MDDQKYWLGFSLIPKIGTKRILDLYNWFGELGSAWHAKERDLRQSGLDGQSMTNVLQHRETLDLDSEMEKIEKAGAWLLTLHDARYPALLQELNEMCPAVLYVRGALFPQDDLALAIVGTRKPTKYGRDATKHLAQQLAKQGVTIISGLAEGIDSEAHRATLHAGGRTIAIMGCGVDVIYPREHGELAQAIAQNGAIISEFPLGMQPIAANFPRRNRILSGMSLGVLVVEAPEKSGALITASLAAEQGREVFAVPANIFNPSGSGVNRLIQDGAKLVMEVDDILSELNIAHDNVQTKITTEIIQPESETEAKLIPYLGADPIHVDELVRLSGLSIADVNSTLTILELKGVAQMVGHMQYSLSQRY